MSIVTLNDRAVRSVSSFGSVNTGNMVVQMLFLILLIKNIYLHLKIYILVLIQELLVFKQQLMVLIIILL
jgi:hypothetical protein